MLDKVLHRKLLAEGLEGQGVITDQNVEAVKGNLGTLGSIFGVKGHFSFEDGSQGEFSSKALDSEKVGDLPEGTVVPVRYSADHKHVVLDVVKLEAVKAERVRKAREWQAKRKAEEIAAADAKVAAQNQHGGHKH